MGDYWPVFEYICQFSENCVIIFSFCFLGKDPMLPPLIVPPQNFGLHDAPASKILKVNTANLVSKLPLSYLLH